MKPSDIKLILIHGYNIRDGGESTTDRLFPYFKDAGFTNIIEFDYGYFDLIKVRFNSKQKAQELADLIGGQPAVVCCHSHGNVIADIAATEFDAPIYYHIGINPALSVEADFAPQIQKIDIYHTPGDRVVTMAKWLRYLSPISWIKPHYWGEAGRYGIKTEDQRVKNFNMQDHPSGLKPIHNHSSVFKFRNLREWGPEIASMARYRVEKLKERSDYVERADLYSMSVKLGEKALSNGYIVTFGEFKNGSKFSLNFRKNNEKITRPDDLVKYWAELGGEYDNGYFTV